MKPNFALSLSFDGIKLLHRRFPGWTLVDEVALDTGDLPGALAALRARAVSLDASGLRTKLIIPNDQIRFLSTAAPPDDGQSPEAAVRAALEGATPYAVDDLAYDWSTEGDTLKIAAVARETLTEAEAFATDHAFAPVSFVAIPETGDFTGEPFFGTTAHARTLLPEGAEVARDDAPVRIIGVSKPVAASDAEAPVVTVDSDAVTAPAGGTAPAPDEVDTSGPADSPTEDEIPAESVSPPDTGPGAEPVVAAGPEAPEDDDTSGPAPAEEADTAVAKPFTSIRASRHDVPTAAPRLDAPTRLSGLIPGKKAEGKKKTGKKAPRKRTRKDDGALRPGAAGATLPPAPELPSPGSDTELDSAHIAQAAASLRPDPAERLDSAATPAETDTAPARTTFFSGRKPRGTSTPAADPASDARSRFEDEKQRMTVFGARHAEVGGKPRFLGLILTAALLLFLVGVAAWASIFLDDGLARLFGDPDPTSVAEATDETTPPEPTETAMPAEPPPAPANDTTTADAPAAQQPTESETAALAPQETQTVPPAQDPVAPEPATGDSILPEPLTPSAALARYAATGIWQMAPEPPAVPRATGDAERLFSVAVDPDVRFDDPDDLPGDGTARHDTPPPPPAGPPAPGVTFDFNENGLVRATPEGVMTPLGVRVYARAPDFEAPQSFLNRIPAPEAETETETPAEPQAETPAETPADTGTDSDTAEQPDGQIAVLDPDNSSSPLAAKRPRARPGSIAGDTAEDTTETAEEATVDADALDAAVAMANASATGEEEEEARDETLFEDATAQAVTASLTPATRPANFAAIVERARDQAAGDPVHASQVLAPGVPSSASVAREATESNVLNLRKVNLIGVYGAPSSRRALVRLSNGRYKKVKVGDRLDGGKVAAIGDSELRYIKKGRNVTLRMPRG